MITAGLVHTGRALDPSPSSGDFRVVEESKIKVIGQLQKTPWQRFARLQRTAARLAQGRGQPKGVFRFSSNEACTAWTANLNRSGK
jgi:predicted mannosyl-3-phosphoglycerate phosphatase (HAD superfamily)